MRDQNYLFHILHTLDNLIAHSPLMSFNACKLIDNLKLQDPKLLLQWWPAMLQSSKVVQAYSTVTPLFCSRGSSRKGNHDQVGEITRTRQWDRPVTSTQARRLVWFVGYGSLFTCFYISVLYDSKQFRNITENKLHVYIITVTVIITIITVSFFS